MTVTSRKALIAKLIFAALLPLLSLLAFAFIDDFYSFFAFTGIAVLFNIPFAVNAVFIKQSVLEKKHIYLKKLILSDLLFITLPSILSVVLLEVFFSFFLKEFGNGLITVVLCVMFILISAANWIMYPIRLKGAVFSEKIKRPTRHDDRSIK